MKLMCPLRVNASHPERMREQECGSHGNFYCNFFMYMLLLLKSSDLTTAFVCEVSYRCNAEAAGSFVYWHATGMAMSGVGRRNELLSARI